MDVEKLREKLPNKGYIARINKQLELSKKEQYSGTYISNVLKAHKQKNGVVAYNQDIIDAAIIVAREYQATVAKQGKQIEKI